MKNIIKKYRDYSRRSKSVALSGTIKEVPLMTAKHNAKVRKLLNELDFIRNAPNDPDVKIAALIDIMVRGIDFKC
jgi:hypothetical protein